MTGAASSGVGDTSGSTGALEPGRIVADCQLSLADAPAEVCSDQGTGTGTGTEQDEEKAAC
jgi:hypothetical protein